MVILNKNCYIKTKNSNNEIIQRAIAAIIASKRIENNRQEIVVIKEIVVIIEPNHLKLIIYSNKLTILRDSLFWETV